MQFLSYLQRELFPVLRSIFIRFIFLDGIFVSVTSCVVTVNVFTSDVYISTTQRLEKIIKILRLEDLLHRIKETSSFPPTWTFLLAIIS